MNNKSSARQKIRYRIRKKISGAAAKPRLSVFRSNTDIYAQLIDDASGVTIAAASSKQKEIAAQKAPKTEKSKMVGTAIANKAKELGIESVALLPFQEPPMDWVDPHCRNYNQRSRSNLHSIQTTSP